MTFFFTARRLEFSRVGGGFCAMALLALALFPTLARGADTLPTLQDAVVRNASKIVPEPDGKLIVAGEPPDDGSALPLLRFRANGEIDHRFKVSGVTLLSLDAIVRLPEGKFLLAGSVATAGGAPAKRLLKLHRNGSLDANFQPGTKFAPAPLVQSDGCILLLRSEELAGGVIQPKISRLHADGSLDRSFHTGVALLADSTYNLRLQSDDKILVIGKDGASFGQPSLQRLESDGWLDRTFHAAAPVAAGYGVCALAVAPDGKLLVAEYANEARDVCTLYRLETDGSLDPDFAPPAPLAGRIDHLFEDASGRVLFNGDFTKVNGIARPGFARLKSDGRLDPNFDPLADTAVNFYGFVATEVGTVTFARALTSAESAGFPSPGILLELYGADGSSVSVVKIAPCPACELVPAGRAGVYVQVEDRVPVESAAGAATPAPADGLIAPPAPPAVTIVRPP